jgi:hypothetical protein
VRASGRHPAAFFFARRIAAMHAAGRSQEAIARSLKMPRQTVTNVIARIAQSGPGDEMGERPAPPAPPVIEPPAKSQPSGFEVDLTAGSYDTGTNSGRPRRRPYAGRGAAAVRHCLHDQYRGGAFRRGCHPRSARPGTNGSHRSWTLNASCLGQSPASARRTPGSGASHTPRETRVSTTPGGRR